MPKGKHKKVTIATIASETGLARSTVGFILNGQTRDRRIAAKTSRRVLAAARRLQYVPNDVARSLRRRRTGVIGVIFAHLREHWAERAVLGMRSVLDPADYVPFITTHQSDRHWQQREIQTLLGRQVEAIICMPLAEDLDAYRMVMERGVPLVFLGDYLNEMPQVSFAAWETGSAARAALRHLLGLGRRRIAYIGWDDPRPMRQAPFAAYREALREARLEFREDWVVRLGHGNLPTRRVAGMFTRKGPRPDAVMARTDAYGVAALSVLEKRGIRVPGDVAIIGMDDLPGSDFPGVGLSTMVFPAEEVGRKAAQIALELIQTPAKAPIRRLIEHVELIARRTTVGLPEAGHGAMSARAKRG